MRFLCRALLVGALSLATFAIGVGQQISGVTISPNPATGGGSFTGTVTLTKAAGTAGLKITLASSATAVATVPASVTVASGHTTATFTGTTERVTTDSASKISATDPTKKSETVSLVVDPPAVRVTALSLSPASVVATSDSTGTVTLSNAAPSSGVTVKLASSEPYAKAPASVSVKSGMKTATFKLTTSAVATNSTATISATDPTGYEVSAVQTITVPVVRLTSLTISPTTVTAANPATAKITLSADAPSGGFAINLSTLQTYISAPATITVPSGAHTATFTILTLPVTSGGTASVTATDKYGYVSVADLTVDIPTVRLNKFTISPSSVTATSNATGTVALTANAPTGGFLVYLSTMQTYVSVPMSVTVPAGKSSTTFTIGTSAVTTASTATIDAQDANGYSKTASLTVNPQPVSGAITMTSQFSFSPQTLTVPAGTVVTWTNVSMMDHTATSDIPSQNINSPAVTPNGKYSWTVPANAASGTTFYYHCVYHGNSGNGTGMGTGMAGVIIVK